MAVLSTVLELLIRYCVASIAYALSLEFGGVAGKPLNSDVLVLLFTAAGTAEAAAAATAAAAVTQNSLIYTSIAHQYYNVTSGCICFTQLIYFQTQVLNE